MKTVILAVLILTSPTFQIHGKNFKTAKLNNKLWMGETQSVEIKGRQRYNQYDEFAHTY
jgi:hypothetical protein